MGGKKFPVTDFCIDEKSEMVKMTWINTWIHRISHRADISYPLLEKGFLSIGYVDFANRDFLKAVEEGGRQALDDAFQKGWQQVPRTRHNLWRFISEMKIGDKVLIPSWGTFSIYEIESDATPINELPDDHYHNWSNETVVRQEGGLYHGEKQVDLGFFRRVKPIAVNISRSDFADSALTSRMKIRTTNADITDLSVNVESALEAYRTGKPINLHSQILAASQEKVLQLILENLNPSKFENLIAWYFKKIGASEVTIPAKNERGKEGDADIVAVFESLRTIIYVQAKFHTGETSEWATQQIKEYTSYKNQMDDGYTRIPWVVTTAESFSENCINLAKESGVSLFPGRDVAQMLLEVGIETLDKAF